MIESKQSALRCLSFLWVVGSLAIGMASEHPPNLLLIIADDCTYRDMQVYGGQAQTPHLNQLAKEGMVFSHCFQAAPMCSPTRHCLYTGLYPVKSGAYPNHTMAYDWVESIATYAQQEGYRTQLSGKTHIQPKSVFPFEYTGAQNPDMAAVDKLFEECATSATPFLLIAASNEPHSPWNKGNAEDYPASELVLPPVLADSPDTRDDFSRYLAEITYFDGQVGNILELLANHGHSENTMVVVLSEQGNSFPFAKWTCYDVGLRSGCIVRWPGQIAAGSTSDALVEYVDIVPTFLDVIGAETPDILDGRSFLNVLTGAAQHHKSHVYGLQTTRGINNGSKFFGIRSVRDARYRYIRNFTPEVTFQNAMTADPVFKTWKQMASQGNKHAAQLVHDYQHRPAEELYDCEADPWNRHNLIDEPSLRPVREELRGSLDAWMKSQGDEGQASELRALERMPKHDESEEKGEGKRKAAAGQPSSDAQQKRPANKRKQ